jgi:AAA family ATP:ADP antiporter
VHKAIASFGSSVVFLLGTGMAMALFLSAWGVVRAQRALSRG